MNLEPYEELLAKPLSTMTAEERATVATLIDEMKAARPEASEPDIVSLFQPGAIAFLDSRYSGVSPSVDVVWPQVEWWLSRLLDVLPHAHRLEYLRERI